MQEELNSNTKAENSAWRTIHFIPDTPLDQFDPDHPHFDPNDAPRCEPLAEQLARQLLAFLYPPKESNQPKGLKAPRIGVFGGLGQGKTTAIKWALYKTDKSLAQALLKLYYREEKLDEMPCTVRLEEQFVEWFDTAHYKNDTLEYELDRLLGGLGSSNKGDFFAAMSAYAIPAIFVVAPISIVLSSNIDARVLTGFIAPIWALFLWLSTPFVYWWRSGQRSGILGHKLWWKQGKKLLLKQINILVIDNLDRASLDQQRAVLRALYKHRDDLGYAVIIGFDETRLLDSAPDPESPRELLRKAINVEVRMPVRVLTDSLRLAWMATNEAANLNPGLRALLTNTLALGALARILELLAPVQPVSPRAAKHMVNNALFYMAQVKNKEIVRVEDWRAALRLQALLTIAPELRNHGERLRQALQCNELDGLESVLYLLPSGDKEAARDKSTELASKVFNATRHFAPPDHDWSPWVLGWYSISMNPDDTGAATLQAMNTVWDEANFERVDYLFDSLYRIVQGLPSARLANLTDVMEAIPFGTSLEDIKTIGDLPAIALMPLLDILLTRLNSAEKKRLLYELWQAAERGDLQWLFDKVDKKYWYFYLAEMTVLEDNPWPLSSQQQFDSWWGVLAFSGGISIDMRMHLLSLLSVSCFHLVEILAYGSLLRDKGGVMLGVKSWFTGYGSANDSANTLPFPSPSRFTLPDNPLELAKHTGINAETVKRLWPPLTVSNRYFPGLLAEHCRAWQCLQLYGGQEQTHPLANLLFTDDEFGQAINVGNAHEKYITGLAELYGSLQERNWTDKAWLGLLQPYLNLSDKKDRQRLSRLRQLQKRFSLLWNKPCQADAEIEVQCMLAASFPGKSKLQELLGALSEPLSASAHNVIIANVRHWAELCAHSVWKPDSDGLFHGTHSAEQYAELLLQAWLRKMSSLANNATVG